MKQGSRRKSALALFVAALYLSMLMLPIQAADTTNKDTRRTLTVDGGDIKGTLSSDKSVEIYKGIPFAAAPVGDLRWKAPQPVVPWTGVRQCVEYGPSAIQAPQSAFMYWSTEFIVDTSKGYSEDCLFLNVWTERYRQDDKRPVIVYIHGGANVSGGASCDVYDGEGMARKDVVYVTINYRVGILGFLAHPALSAESSDGISGNYAIMDQIAALEWVKRNISQFGGDPDNVTIAGQSAGSFNVHSLVSSPMAKGLFKNAVAMSGNSISSTLPTLKEKEAQGEKTFSGKTLAEMRAMSTDDILKLAPTYSSSTCIDGKVITSSVLDSYKNGTANEVNMITGMVDGDSALFPILSSDAAPFTYTRAISKDQYEAAVRTQFGELADLCLTAYPATSNDALDVFNQLNVEGSMALQSYLAKARTLKAGNRTYIYDFTHIMPGPEASRMGAFHTADVPYWLNHFSLLRDDYWAKVDYRLGDRMSSYLVNFAKTGNPNGGSLPAWKPYVRDKIEFNSLGDQVFFKSLTNDQVRFWQAFFGSQLGL